jgi:hypothetical protein
MIYSESDTSSIINFQASTFYDSAKYNNQGSIYSKGYFTSEVNVLNSTILSKKELGSVGKINALSTGGWGTTKFKSSVFASDSGIIAVNAFNVISNGNNFFSDSSISGIVLTTNHVTDSFNIDSTKLMLGLLKNNGGNTLSMKPDTGSVLINAGSPSDFSNAQNSIITDSRRDAGAVENSCVTISFDIILSCNSYSTPSGKVLTTSGTYSDTISNMAGCDSIITIYLTIGTKSFSTISPNVCNSFNSPSGKTWTVSNTYSDTIHNGVGCDSIITINLIINTQSTAILSPNTCNNYVSPSGKTWISSGSYMDTISNMAGCDSIITINLTIRSKTTSTISPNVCNSFTSPSGKIWTVSNTYSDTISNAVGCDSIITINLTVGTKSFSTISPNVCNSFTSPSGKIWIVSKTYSDTIPNGVGCDSIITINLTVNTQSTATLSPNTCNNYVSPSGKTWISSGSYMDTILNMAGCDSIISINLTIRTKSTSTISPNVCNSFTSPSGKVWTSSNTYSDTITNVAGCDSIITINLVIRTQSISTLSPNSCNNYVSPSGKTWISSGSYLDTIPNMAGCDSIITINLTLTTLNKGVSPLGTTITSVQSTGSYQWLDCNNGYSIISGETNQNFLIITSGNYAVEITDNGCVDTSNCTSVSRTCFAKFITSQTTIGIVTLQDSTIGSNLRYTWYFGDGDSASAYLPTHTYATSGKYLVCLKIEDTVTFCSDNFCDSINVDTSGVLRNSFVLKVVRNFVDVEESLNEMKTKVFPNPNNGTFTLNLDKELQINSLFITDINGRLIKEITPQKTLNYEISFEGASGIYFLNVVTKNERRTLKLVKE